MMTMMIIIITIIITIIILIILTETSFLWQHISVLMQQFDAILINETHFEPDKAPDLYSC